MKHILVFILALSGIASAHADKIESSIVSTSATEHTMTITFSGSNRHIAFQMDLVLPSGFEYIGCTASTALSNHTLSAQKLQSGNVRIISYSSNNSMITSGTNELFTLKINGSSETDVEFLIKNIRFTKESGEETILENEICTLSPYIPTPSTYTLTYMLDGQVISSEEVTEGTPLTPKEEPTREGHTFNGWSEIPSTMPAHNVVVSGTFTIISGISRVTPDKTGKQWYTITGQLLNQKPQKRGIYVHKGIKILKR